MANNSLSDSDLRFGSFISTQETTDLEAFLKKIYENPLPDFATFSFALDAIDPLAYLEMCWNEETFQYYWEKPRDEFAIAAGGQLLTLTASGSNRFQTISNKLQSARESTAEYSAVPHPFAGMMFLGGFSFFDTISDPLWDSFRPASLTVPKWTIIKDGKFNLLTLGIDLCNFENPQNLHQHLIKAFKKVRDTCRLRSAANKTTDQSQYLGSASLPNSKNGEYSRWITSVNTAKQLIQKQNFDKIVLARHITVPNNQDKTATQILNKLRKEYPNCYNFLIHQADNKTFLGSTPERLGSFRNQLLLTEALAGSIQRGQTATEDSMLEKNLSASSKNINEHNFVIKDIEERLKPMVKYVNRSDRPEVKKLTNVQHLYTPIRAQLKNNTSAMEVLNQLHPTPAVGGYPWQEAAPYIRELENFERGWYASPIGWINSKGMGEFAVGIRSGLMTEQDIRFFAGCGIVADSNPEAEWEETNLKLKPILSALQYD